MLLIISTWILILFFFVTTGTAVKVILNIENKGMLITALLGLFLQCLFLTSCSFFIKIGSSLFLINFIFQILIYYWKKKEIKDTIDDTIIELKSLTNLSKSTLLIILLFSLSKCAQLPFIIDNESYYIQTIKWINEYGIVKGLANLHIFLAQNSPFHILQAGFNFNFLTDRMNDLNGLILCMTSTYFILEFEKQYKENKKKHWIGLVIIFNILFFQFINSPSPDLIIILLTQIIIYIYMEKNNDFSNFKIITFFLLTLIFIKITIAPFGLLILLIISKEKKRILFFSILSILFISTLMIKNTVITGYPLYPSSIAKINVDWKIPEKTLNFISSTTVNSGYFKGDIINDPSLIIKLKSWILMPGINRIFNIGMLLLFIFTPFTQEFKSNRKIKVIYYIFLIHFILLLLISPQFRFFLPEFVFLTALSINYVLNKMNFRINNFRILLVLAILFPLLSIGFIDYKIFTTNKLHQSNSKFNWIQIFIPEKNSKYTDMRFEKIKEGNLEYYSPTVNFFFFGTSNGELPCVNKVQIEYFKTNEGIVPQLRTNEIKDGFYSKKVKVNE